MSEAYIFTCCVYVEVFTNLFKGQHDTLAVPVSAWQWLTCCVASAQSSVQKHSRPNEFDNDQPTNINNKRLKKLRRLLFDLLETEVKCYFTSMTSLFRPQNLRTMYFDWITRNLDCVASRLRIQSTFPITIK